MLIRNLKPPELCNGTRLRITQLTDYTVVATILTGPGAGDSICLPQIPIKNTDYPFEFKRTQYPVKVCFAITINKGNLVFMLFCYCQILVFDSCCMICSSRTEFQICWSQFDRILFFTWTVLCCLFKSDNQFSITYL